MQIAVTLAVLISKIARIDYPKEWYVAYPIMCTFDPNYVQEQQ